MLRGVLGRSGTLRGVLARSDPLQDALGRSGTLWDVLGRPRRYEDFGTFHRRTLSQPQTIWLDRAILEPFRTLFEPFRALFEPSEPLVGAGTRTLGRRWAD